MEHIIQFLEKLVTQFTWRRFLFVTTIVALGVGGFTLFELYTAHFRLTRIERTANLLTTVHEQREQIAKTNDERISQIHDQLIDDLQWSLNGQPNKLAMPTWLLKAAAAAAPWFAIGMVLYFVTAKGEFNLVLGGLLVVTIPIAFIGALIPDFSPSWINYILFPIGIFVVVMVPMFIYGRLQTKTK